MPHTLPPRGADRQSRVVGAGRRSRYHVFRPPRARTPEPPMRLTPVAVLFALTFLAPPVGADDWPQWMGPNRDGVWPETGIVKALPKGDPKQGNRIKAEWSV